MLTNCERRLVLSYLANAVSGLHRDSPEAGEFVDWVSENGGLLGDFAVVRRKADALGQIEEPERLAAMPRAECDAKPDRPRAIGFCA